MRNPLHHLLISPLLLSIVFVISKQFSGALPPPTDDEESSRYTYFLFIQWRCPSSGWWMRSTARCLSHLLCILGFCPQAVISASCLLHVWLDIRSPWWLWGSHNEDPETSKTSHLQTCLLMQHARVAGTRFIRCLWCAENESSGHVSFSLTPPWHHQHHQRHRLFPLLLFHLLADTHLPTQDNV